MTPADAVPDSALFSAAIAACKLTSTSEPVRWRRLTRRTILECGDFLNAEENIFPYQIIATSPYVGSRKNWFTLQLSIPWAGIVLWEKPLKVRAIPSGSPPACSYIFRWGDLKDAMERTVPKVHLPKVRFWLAKMPEYAKYLTEHTEEINQEYNIRCCKLKKKKRAKGN